MIYTLGILIAILLLTPAFLGRTLIISQDITIKQTPSTVFSYLKDLNNFKIWNPFLVEEPNAKVEVKGDGLGATYAWEGEKVGSGIMEIVEIRDENTLFFDMTFKTPFEATAKVEWSVSSVDNNAKITWTMTQDYSYFKRYFKLIMPGMMNKAFRSGLETLKLNLEIK